MSITNSDAINVEGNVNDALQYSNALRFDIRNKFSLVSVRIWPFIGNLVNPYIFIMGYLYSIAKANICGCKDDNTRQLILISEIMGTDMFEERFITRAEACDNLIAAVSNLMRDKDITTYVDISEKIWSDTLTAKNSLLHKFNTPQNAKHWSQSFPWDENAEKTLGPEEAMMVLYWLATKAKRKTAIAVIKTSVIAYLSFSKRGSVPNQSIKKIMQLVYNDLKIEININHAEIRAIYEIFGTLINETNAQRIFAKLDRMLPIKAKNVHSYLKNMSMTGMTCLLTISEALHRAPDFPWMTVDSIIPGELHIFSEALSEVNGNCYYGYKSNMGKAAKKYYENLAYICKELLIKVFKREKLKEYRGWTLTPQRKVFLDMLVCKYKYDLDIKAEKYS